MFNGIRYRLLLSYLLVLASILMVFALAVRVVFTRSLMHQLTEKLRALGEGAAAMAFEDSQIKFNNNVYYERDLMAHEQALQWFDAAGNLIAQQGLHVVSLPLEKRESVQLEYQRRIEAVTLPIVGSNGGEIVGYVRASQSLVKVDETIQNLDWGLAGGIVMALVLSGAGGVWLTRQAMQPIEDSFQRLKQFTADASHELRSPLMAIKSNVAVALRYPEGMREPDREKFEAIASATNQMTQLTEDLLFLARTEQIPRQDWEPVDLGVILQNLINLYKTQAEGKQISLRTSIRENLYVAGDAGQLTRLFVNLIQNALHYTPAGGTIWLSAINFGVYIEVEVRDTGVGIATSDVEKVFERFWRAEPTGQLSHRSRSDSQGGSGLGLAIARAIVQQHGGAINVTSELGIGSCFTVRLPANSPI